MKRHRANPQAFLQDTTARHHWEVGHVGHTHTHTHTLPRPEEKGTLLLRTPKKPEWQREMPFLADLLRWLRALTWTQEPDTVTFLELALDFEELPNTPNRTHHRQNSKARLSPYKRGAGCYDWQLPVHSHSSQKARYTLHALLHDVTHWFPWEDLHCVA
uniref:Uncharacterized protein n=1 Tax=Eutreptiella gymnastica TaxID=73025 RepID=A0A7S4FYH8_9EUGL